MNPNQGGYPNNFQDFSQSYDMQYYTNLLSQNPQNQTGGAYQPMEIPRFSTQPEDLDDSPDQTQHISRGRGRASDAGDTPKPKKCPWSEGADLILINGYINTSTDAVTNTNQTTNSFWKRVQAYWNQWKCSTASDRTLKSCKQRWHLVNGMNPSSESGSTRLRSDMEGDTSNQDTPTSAFIGVDIQRPEGIKVAKRKGKKVASTSCAEDDEELKELARQKLSMCEKVHELSIVKQERKREKQAQLVQMKNIELEQTLVIERTKKWDMLQSLMGKPNLPPEEEVLKMRLMKELSS